MRRMHGVTYIEYNNSPSPPSPCQVTYGALRRHALKRMTLLFLARTSINGYVCPSKGNPSACSRRLFFPLFVSVVVSHLYKSPLLPSLATHWAHHIKLEMVLPGFIDAILSWFRSLFWKQEMELTLVGLQNSGKTTLVNVIAVCIHSSNIHHYNLIHICTLVNTQTLIQTLSFGIFNALLHVTLYNDNHSSPQY